MKRLLVLAIIVVFTFSAVTALAAQATKGKPMSKYPNKGLFQAYSDHIANWGKSSAIVREQSLRGAEKPVERKGTEAQTK
jgi:hypothetical protein